MLAKGPVCRGAHRTSLAGAYPEQVLRRARLQRAVAAGSGTAKGVDHALRRWPAPERYAGSGTLPIDNNSVENAIRPILSAKRTGCSRVRNGAVAAPVTIHSLFATAKLSGLDPARWLVNALERLDIPKQPDRLAVAIPILYPTLNPLYRWLRWMLTRREKCARKFTGMTSAGF